MVPSPIHRPSPALAVLALAASLALGCAPSQPTTRSVTEGTREPGAVATSGADPANPAVLAPAPPPTREEAAADLARLLEAGEPEQDELNIRRILSLGLLDESAYALAWEHLDFVLRHGGDSWWLHLAAAQICLYWSLDYECVREHANRSLEQRPDSARASMYLGQAAEEEGQIEAAMDHYRRVVELRPDELATAIRLAVLLERTGDHVGSVDFLRRLRSENPGSAPVLLQLASAVEDEDPAEAESLLVQAAEVHDNPLHAYGYLLQFYRRQGRTRDAAELERWIREMAASRELRPL
jgi:tetratricopeptide (TPR) repeat protein